VRGKATSNATSGGNAEADEQDGGTAKATANSGIASAEQSATIPADRPATTTPTLPPRQVNPVEAFARSVLQGSAIAKVPTPAARMRKTAEAA